MKFLIIKYLGLIPLLCVSNAFSAGYSTVAMIDDNGTGNKIRIDSVRDDSTSASWTQTPGQSLQVGDVLSPTKTRSAVLFDNSATKDAPPATTIGFTVLNKDEQYIASCNLRVTGSPKSQVEDCTLSANFTVEQTQTDSGILVQVIYK